MTKPFLLYIDGVEVGGGSRKNKLGPTMASLPSAVSKFVASISGIAMSLAYSVLAVFQAIFSLFQELLSGVIKLGESVVELVLDVFQGTLGFVAANFIMIVLLGGGYYLYTRRSKGDRGRSRK